MDFVRKSIRALGQTAVKIDAAAERCVNVLLELIATRISYVVQEAVVVMKVGSSEDVNINHALIKLRTYSANTHLHMKGLSLRCVPISTN